MNNNFYFQDTIRGSQEMIKKLISSKDRLSGVVSSSSSEKAYSVTNTSTTSNKSNNTSSKNLIQNVKEKFGRRRSSKEHHSNATGDISGQSEQENQEKMVNLETSANADKGPDMAIAELDSVINR